MIMSLIWVDKSENYKLENLLIYYLFIRTFLHAHNNAIPFAHDNNET
jgi:hypothetical protein